MAKQHAAMTGIGWVISVLIGVMLAFSATMKLMNPPEMADQFVGKFGYSEEMLVPLAVVEITCMVIYLIPRTEVLGAILLTGYLGGATATHARVHDNFVPPIVAGALVWLALYLRDPRVRALVPWRQLPAMVETKPTSPAAKIG